MSGGVVRSLNWQFFVCFITVLGISYVGKLRLDAQHREITAIRAAFTEKETSYLSAISDLRQMVLKQRTVLDEFSSKIATVVRPPAPAPAVGLTAFALLQKRVEKLESSTSSSSLSSISAATNRNLVGGGSSSSNANSNSNVAAAAAATSVALTNMRRELDDALDNAMRRLTTRLDVMTRDVQYANSSATLAKSSVGELKLQIALLKEQLNALRDDVKTSFALARGVVVDAAMAAVTGNSVSIDSSMRQQLAKNATSSILIASPSSNNNGGVVEKRAKAVAILQSRIYDVTVSSDADRLDLLDSIHVELDNVVRECGCGRDGASNSALQRSIYLNISLLVKPNVVCETGFGAGHGAAAFLLGARKRAVYIGFDLFSHAYVRRAADMITELFSLSTVKVLEGSSGINVPKYFEALDETAFKTGIARTRCEISHIDGGRFQGIALKDLRELHKHAAEGSIVIMDDAICESTNEHLCAEPGRAWHRMKLESKVVEQQCYKKESEGVSFCVGTFRHVPK